MVLFMGETVCGARGMVYICKKIPFPIYERIYQEHN